MKLARESLLLHLKKAQSGNIGLSRKDLDGPKVVTLAIEVLRDTLSPHYLEAHSC